MQEHERIGQYEVVGQVGKGGMATVYKAYHERLDRHVAVKVMHPAFNTDEGFVARFQREARIVGKLEHPNIVPIYDYAENEGNPYLVMKYIEGMTLKQKALKTGLTLKETLDLMERVADALDYAHAQGVLHRDMKPSNILIDADGKPYITDFGLARMAQMGESTISHDMMLGTPFYISPEQAQGEKNLTSSTDVYSLAIILYELITGRVPFVADSTYAIVHGHIYTAPEAPSSLNPDLNDNVDQVFERALAKSPSDRYSTARDMVSAFKRAIEPELDSPLSQSSQAQNNVKSPTPQRGGEVSAPPPAPSIPPMPAMPKMPELPTMPELPKLKGDKRYKIESRIDLEQMNWSEVGQRLKAGVVSIADKIENVVDGEMLRRMGLSSGDPSEQIRKRVEKRIKKRQELIDHLTWYLIINVGVWVGFTVMTRSFPFWAIFMTLGWGLGLFGHWQEYYTKYGAGANKRNREIQDEIDRELAMMSGEGRMKRKNPTQREEERTSTSLDALLDDDIPSVRINDEGEFTDSFVKDRRKRR